MYLSALSVVLLLGIGAIHAQTTPSAVDPCSLSLDCGSCVQDKRCFFCDDNFLKCESLSSSSFFSGGGKTCKNLTYKWATCSVEAYAFLIAIVIGVFLILVSFFCCVCCCVCCCVRRRKRVVQVEEYRATEERALIHKRAAARKADRQSKNDEVRQKYGLLTSDSQFV
eukprot:Em0004g684a